jgi:hypothetical protein
MPDETVKEDCVTKRFKPEPHARTVHEHAQRRLHIALDKRLPIVMLDSSLGQECRTAIDSAYELHRCCRLFLVDHLTQVVRFLATELLTEAIKSGKIPSSSLESLTTRDSDPGGQLSESPPTGPGGRRRRLDRHR